MRTTALSGEIHIDSRPSVIGIDLRQLLGGWDESEVTWEERADNSNNGADFDSSEARRDRDRPKLTVNYTMP